MGAPAAASWIAHAVFWGVLLLGLASREWSWLRCALLTLLWLAGFTGLSYAPIGSALFTAFVAVLDIWLVFLVFNGDVRLT